MRRLCGAVGLLLLAASAGCGHDGTVLNDDPFKGTPDDPLVCTGDPDTTVVCKHESEFWDCTTMPNGEVKCTRKEPQTPGGSGKWQCVRSGEKIVCASTDAAAPPDGSGGWRCTTEGGKTTCEKDAPVPPGGGAWTCSLDNEFHWSCSGGTKPPPSTPSSSPVPPGWGSYDCYDAAAGSNAPTLPPNTPWGTVLSQKVTYNGEPAVHVKVTFNKVFVDNTYGINSSPYLTNKGATKQHTFQDLVGSDKVELFFADIKGNLAMHIVVDYISASTAVASGYDCLGVTGGDGKVVLGNASNVLAARSSLDVNFNDYGYVLTQDSPVTDSSYAPDPKYPKWIFEVWYEVWVKWSAFGPDGPSKAYITGIHASPSRVGSNTIPVEPGKCP